MLEEKQQGSAWEYDNRNLGIKLEYRHRYGKSMMNNGRKCHVKIFLSQ